MKRIFVTGTDTEIGKTVVACGLVAAATQAGYRAIGLKPVAAGCELKDGELVNDDATQLIAASNVALDYAIVNPVALEPAIAPHIAAQKAGVSIAASSLATHFKKHLPHDLDLAVYEGAGGWFVPLNDYETFQDFAQKMELDIVLVVGMKLGCINHALLTAAAIQRAKLNLVGWIANFSTQQMAVANENLETLLARLPSELLGIVPHLAPPSADQVAKHLNIETLMA